MAKVRWIGGRGAIFRCCVRRMSVSFLFCGGLQ
jgi:hypothetical protein